MNIPPEQFKDLSRTVSVAFLVWLLGLAKLLVQWVGHGLFPSLFFLAAVSLCCGKEAPHCSARDSLIVAGRLSCPLRGRILVPRGIELMRDEGLNSCVPCIGKWILNHWTSREALNMDTDFWREL